MTFPDNPNFHPWLSSVDNGWLAVGLRIVENSVPQLRKRAGALYDAMDWGFYYRPDVNRVLFHYQPEPLDAPCCYDTVVSESRIVDYLGVAPRAAAAEVLLRPLAHVPGHVRLVLDRDPAGRRRDPPATSASTSSRRACRTPACASSPRGAGACSRR